MDECTRCAKRVDRWHAAPMATCHLIVVLVALQEAGLLRN